MIGEEFMAISQNHEFRDIKTPMRKQGWQPDRPIIIENDVWIGAITTFLSGVTIGKGAVIGAASVVTKK